jgi:hypothetical protein
LYVALKLLFEETVKDVAETRRVETRRNLPLEDVEGILTQRNGSNVMQYVR